MELPVVDWSESMGMEVWSMGSPPWADQEGLRARNRMGKRDCRRERPMTSQQRVSLGPRDGTHFHPIGGKEAGRRAPSCRVSCDWHWGLCTMLGIWKDGDICCPAADGQEWPRGIWTLEAFCRVRRYTCERCVKEHLPRMIWGHCQRVCIGYNPPRLDRWRQPM
jgi:hypothetical protein